MNQLNQNIQKNSGIKMSKYDSKQNELYNQGLVIIKMLELYIKSIEETKMTNEQFFINFLDSINELSVKY